MLQTACGFHREKNMVVRLNGFIDAFFTSSKHLHILKVRVI